MMGLLTAEEGNDVFLNITIVNADIESSQNLRELTNDSQCIFSCKERTSRRSLRSSEAPSVNVNTTNRNTRRKRTRGEDSRQTVDSDTMPRPKKTSRVDVNIELNLSFPAGEEGMDSSEAQSDPVAGVCSSDESTTVVNDDVMDTAGHSGNGSSSNDMEELPLEPLEPVPGPSRLCNSVSSSSLNPARPASSSGSGETPPVDSNNAEDNGDAPGNDSSGNDVNNKLPSEPLEPVAGPSRLLNQRTSSSQAVPPVCEDSRGSSDGKSHSHNTY
jgi:hypothetical protein